MTVAGAFSRRVEAALQEMDERYWASETAISETWYALLANKGLRIALHTQREPVVDWVPLEPLRVIGDRTLRSRAVLGPYAFDLVGVDGVVFDVAGTLDFAPPFKTKLGMPRGTTYRYEVIQPLGDALPWFTVQAEDDEPS